MNHVWLELLNDLNPVKLNYYPFMISLDKCNGSCNFIDDFNMTTRINVAKN